MQSTAMIIYLQQWTVKSAYSIQNSNKNKELISDHVSHLTARTSYTSVARNK